MFSSQAYRAGMLGCPAVPPAISVARDEYYTVRLLTLQLPKYAYLVTQDWMWYLPRYIARLFHHDQSTCMFTAGN